LPPEARQPGILALLADSKPMQTLLEHLRQLGMHVDVATDVASARTLFFGAGGHDCLVVGPGVRPGIVAQVTGALRVVDPQLAIASFGPPVDSKSAPARCAMLAGFHPGSRAGTGALVRFLRAVKLR
jgi:hypothetical protein